MNVKLHGDHSYENYRDSSREFRWSLRQVEKITGEINQSAGYAGQGIDVFSKKQWHFIKQDITDDATHRACDGAHDDADPEGKAELETFGDTDDGKESQSNGVEKEKGVAPAKNFFTKQQGYKQRHAGGDEVTAVGHPEGRNAQQQVSGGAAANGCHQPDDVGAKPVDLFSRRQSDATDGECKGAEQVEYGCEIELQWI